MADSIEKHGLDVLTSAQRERLQTLASSLSYDKLTVSFSIEDRDANGRKKSCFYCVTASRGHDVDPMAQPDGVINTSVGYTESDARLAHCLLSKHVIAATYSDAVRRGLMPLKAAKEEMQAILKAYDDRIAALLEKDLPSNETD